MSWLVRMSIDAQTAYSKKITDNYMWHKRVWDCFPSSPTSERNFLTRIDRLEGFFRVWILSRQEPACPSWCEEFDFEIKKIAPTFLSHRHYAFDLRANPVKKLVQRSPDTGKRKSGKRVTLVDPGELRAWLVRKGDARCRDPLTGNVIPGGFKILDDKPLEISPMVENHFRKKDHKGYHGGVDYRGVLEITDQRMFTETYYNGVGSAKAFGFGLFLLAPVSI